MLTKDQEKALKKFSKNKVAALFMEMGTGKTRTSVELANNQSSMYDQILWIGPVSTIENSKKEVEKWGGFAKKCQYIGYETIASSDRSYLKLRDSLKGKRIFLICDESLFLKNGDTKRWVRTNCIRKDYAEFCILLNGTPMSRDEMDIFWQMELLSPKILGIGEREFISAMFTKVSIKNGRNKKIYYKRCQKNMPWLKARIEPYIFECSLNLPLNCYEEEKSIRLSDFVSNQYAEAKSDFLKAVKDEREFMILALLSKMKCITACDNYKNDTIAKEIEDTKCIVFCEYRDEIGRIYKMTKNGSFKIDGDTSMDERKKIVEAWSESKKPLLIMFGCGAFGLNLQYTNDIRFASLPWDYAKYSQALHRVYRIGQSNDIKITKYKQRVGISNIVDYCLWKKSTIVKIVKELDWRKSGI